MLDYKNVISTIYKSTALLYGVFMITFLAVPFIVTEFFHIPIFTAIAGLVNRIKKKLILL